MAAAVGSHSGGKSLQDRTTPRQQVAPAWSVLDQSRRHRPPGTAASRPGALRRYQAEGAGRSRRTSRTTRRPEASSGGRSQPSLGRNKMPRPPSSSNTQARPKSATRATQQRTKPRVERPVGFTARALPLGDGATEVGLNESRRRIHGPVSPLTPRQTKVTATQLATDQGLPEALCEPPHIVLDPYLHPHCQRVKYQSAIVPLGRFRRGGQQRLSPAVAPSPHPFPACDRNMIVYRVQTRNQYGPEVDATRSPRLGIVATVVAVPLLGMVTVRSGTSYVWATATGRRYRCDPSRGPCQPSCGGSHCIEHRR
jgi:hypothetical protein